MTASVKGLNNGGEYDSDALNEAQYWNFNRISQRIIRTRGGNPDLADALVESPDSPTFRQWTESISGNPVLVSFTSTELWYLLGDAKDETLRASAINLKNAFEFFTSIRKPDDKRTWITFEMESNWGEFGIVTPGAVIGGGDSAQFAVKQPLSLGPAKLAWGSPNSSTKHLIVVLVVPLIVNSSSMPHISTDSMLSMMVHPSTSTSVPVLARPVSRSSTCVWFPHTLLLLTDTATQREYVANGETKWYPDVPVTA